MGKQWFCRFEVMYTLPDFPVDYQSCFACSKGVLSFIRILGKEYAMDVFGVVGATASFTFESSVAVLERARPDYRGLHVNLCDLLQAHEDELARRPAQMAQNGQ